MNDEYYMEFAIHLASAAMGQTSPNPVVGSVIVKEGEMVGYGSHLKPGGAHAEVHALNMAGDRAKGGTMYVTLEPCNHYGKTPPCTESIIQAGIKEVVIASEDRNPLVAGKGIARLKNARIKVRTGILKEQADPLNEVFFHFIQSGKPFVTLKQAITLDGKTAAETGHSKWNTSEEARRDVHIDRGRHDAILAGIGTVMADDPRLTNRYGPAANQPIRIVLDTHLRMPLESKLVNDSAAPTWIITGSQAADTRIAFFKDKNIEIVKLEQQAIEVEELLLLLGRMNITSLYVEGGQSVNASFIKSRNVNQFITYVAPKFVGGKEAPGMVASLGVETMDQSYPLVFKKIERLGDDIKIISKWK